MVKLTSGSSGSKWLPRSPVEVVRSTSGGAKSQSESEYEPSILSSLEDYYDGGTTDQSDGSSMRSTALKPLTSIRKKISDARQDERREEGYEVNWNAFSDLISDIREDYKEIREDYYADDDDDDDDDDDEDDDDDDEDLSLVGEEQGGGFLGYFGLSRGGGGDDDDRDEVSSADSISTEDEGEKTDRTDGDDNTCSNAESDTLASLSKGVAMVRSPSHFEKLYAKRHGTGTNRDSSASSVATGNTGVSTETYLDRFARKMDIASPDDIESQSEVEEETPIGKYPHIAQAKPSKEGGFSLTRNPSFARLFKKRRGKKNKKKHTSASGTLEGDLSESIYADDETSRDRAGPSRQYQTPDGRGGGTSRVPGNVLMMDEVPMDRTISCISHGTSVSSRSSLTLSKKRSQKYVYAGTELRQVGDSRDDHSIGSEAKLKQMMDAEAKRAAYERQQIQHEEEEARAVALAAAEADERAEAKRIAKEEKRRHKLLKAEEKRERAQQKKLRDQEKRAASIAEAEAKQLEAEAKLAAIKAEAAVKKREAEERKAEEKRAAEIAAAKAERFEAEARRAVAEQRMREAEARKAAAEEVKRHEAEARKAAAEEAAAEARRVDIEETKWWLEAETRKAEKHAAEEENCPDDEKLWTAVAAEAERKTHIANQKKAVTAAVEAEARKAAAAKAKRQEAEARKSAAEEAAEEARRHEAGKRKTAAASRKREAKQNKAKQKKAEDKNRKKNKTEKKLMQEKKLAAERKKLSFSLLKRGKKKKNKNIGELSQQTLDAIKRPNPNALHQSNLEMLDMATHENDAISVESDLLPGDNDDTKSCSTIHLTPKATPLHRTTTYQAGEVKKRNNLQRPGSCKAEGLDPIPTARSVSFQRNESHRNNAIGEEDLEQNRGTNGMSLSDNKFVSSRSGIMSVASKLSHRKYCVYEYEEESNAAAMYCEFNSDPVNMVKVYKYDSIPKLREDTGEVLIKVQASTVSYSDCLIRQGLWWGGGRVILPGTPGVDVVGRVSGATNSALSKYGIQSDDYVASLIRNGGNARYVKVDASKLVKVPREVDPASAVCIVETYLAAFQSLHLGEDTDTRYKKDALLGKSILIIGGIAMVGQAMIELAFLAGASTVYVTARQKHFDFLRSLGAIPVPLEIDGWLPFVRGRMDVVVDAYCTDHYSTSQSALNERGKLICIRTKSTEVEPGLLWHAEALWAKLNMNIDQMSRTYTYDVFESWEENLRLCKNDLKHMFEMLRMGIIEPPIADCIPLTKVPQAQRMYETKRIQGYFVCEPWLKQKTKAAYC